MVKELYEHTPQLIHSEAQILVLNKPSGTPSVSLNKREKKTVATWLLEKFPEQSKLPNGALEAGLVHRLDNDTSGVIVAARTNESLEILKREFKNGTAKKTYIALVMGSTPSDGKITKAIAHHPRKKKKMVVCEGKDVWKEMKARAAETFFKTKQRYRMDENRYSLLEVTISSGARHQIRAHLASEGYPIVGDKLYQSKTKQGEDVCDIGRHFLHASKISFVHPMTGKEVCFESELPCELKTFLSKLKKA